MAQGIFITGTDTDIGKTIVVAGLLRMLRSRGIAACSMKPVQTGARREGERLIAIDLEYHHRAAGMEPDAEELAWMAPFLYEPACSPHLAGRLAGRYPDLGVIASCYEELAARYEVVLVEGAGGVYAPIDESNTMVDLMKTLGLPVVLVARRGLGTINHSLLSIDVLRNAGLNVLGVIFNETEDVSPDFIREDNPRAVQQFGNVPILGNVDYLAGVDENLDEAWARFEECLTGLDAIVPGVPAR